MKFSGECLEPSRVSSMRQPNISQGPAFTERALFLRVGRSIATTGLHLRVGLAICRFQDCRLCIGVLFFPNVRLALSLWLKGSQSPHLMPRCRWFLVSAGEVPKLGVRPFYSHPCLPLSNQVRGRPHCPNSAGLGSKAGLALNYALGRAISRVRNTLT